MAIVEKVKEGCKYAAKSISQGARYLALAGILGLAGCGSLGRYFENRASDLADVVQLKAGVSATPGIGARVKATDLCWLGVGAVDEIKYGFIVDGRNIGFENSENNHYLGLDFIQINALVRKLRKEPGPNNALATYREGSRKQIGKSSEILVPSKDYIEKVLSLVDSKNREKLRKKIRVSDEVKSPVVRLYEDDYLLFSGKRNVFEISLEDFVEEGTLLGRLRKEHRKDPEAFDKRLAEGDASLLGSYMLRQNNIYEIIDPQGQMLNVPSEFVRTEKTPRELINCLDTGGEVTALGFNLGIGVRPGAFIDFLSGIVGLDLEKDDKR